MSECDDICQYRLCFIVDIRHLKTEEITAKNATVRTTDSDQTHKAIN